MFFTLLCATIGGSLKTCFKYGSCLVMVLQCFILIASKDGSRGSQETVQTGLLLVVGEAGAGRRAISLEMAPALALADFIKPGE